MDIFGAAKPSPGAGKEQGGGWFASPPPATDAKLVKPPAQAAWNPFGAADSNVKLVKPPGEQKTDAGGGGGWFGAPAAQPPKNGAKPAPVAPAVGGNPKP